MLACLWIVLVAVPTGFVVATGEGLYTSAPAVVVAMVVVEGALGVAAGFIFRRSGTKRQLITATAYGVLTMGTAATIQVLSYSSYAGDPPWAAALVINVIANTPLVVITVGLGVALGAWIEHRSR